MFSSFPGLLSRASADDTVHGGNLAPAPPYANPVMVITFVGVSGAGCRPSTKVFLSQCKLGMNAVVGAVQDIGGAHRASI